MARNKYSEEIKTKLIKEFKAGATQKYLADKFSMPKSVVCRLIQKFRAHDSVQTIHLGGRPRSSTSREDLSLIRKIKSNPF